MSVHWHRRWRQTRRVLGYVFAAVVIALALVMGAVSQLMPWVQAHPDRVAQWLSTRAGRPVAFDQVQAHWTRRGPLLQLRGMRVGGGDAPPLALGDVEMLVSQYAGLLPGRAFTELRVRGLELVLERDVAGRWQLRGLPGQQQTGGDPLAALEGLGELQIVGARLAVLAPDRDIEAHLQRIDARVQVDGARVRAGVRAWVREEAAPVTAVLDLDRERGTGRAWSAVADAELGAWQSLLNVAGVRVLEGRGDAQAWLTLQDHRVTGLQVHAALQRVQLQGAPLPVAGMADPAAATVAFDQVYGRGIWRTAGQAWQASMPQLRIKHDGVTQNMDGLSVAGGDRIAVEAPHVDAGPLLAVAALSDRLAPAMRRWLMAARPRAVLHALRVSGSDPGHVRVQGRVSDAGFAPVGNAPGLEGLGAELLGDADALWLRPDPDALISFDWLGGFGVPHQFQLRGDIAAWRQGDGWRVGTSAMHLQGSDYSADVRGGLWWQGDGTRPRIDLAAQLGPAPVAAAKRFWIRSQMPAAVIDWLDRALVAGTVQDGRAVVSGDLDDWPFRDANGLFHARARLQDATLRYHADWPAAQALNGQVDFVADGFEVTGRARIAEVPVSGFRAGIAHFDQSELAVQAQGAGDAARLLALVRDSPLRKRHSTVIDPLRAAGPAQARFAMQLPLRSGSGGPSIDGAVELQGVRLADTRLNLAFERVRGRAEFSHDGFHAERMQVMHNARPGRLSLRAGNDVREQAHAFEAELQSEISASALLDRAEGLDWLKPHVSGTSPWTVAVAVPRGGTTALPGRVQLSSTLVGTRLDLPAPLGKPARQSLATRVEIPLPLDNGDIAVALGRRIALRARIGQTGTGIRAVLGSDRVEQPPPASGWTVQGRTDTLDALDWAMLARAGVGGGQSGRGGMPLRGVDISASDLRLIGSRFPDTRLQLTPLDSGAMAAQLSGPALAGRVVVPAADGAAVTGQLQRMHWRRAVDDADRSAAIPAELSAQSNDGIDPSRIPPLTIDAGDVRVGNARLGSVQLHTRPMPGGLRIEQLKAASPGQAITVSGDWTGRGPAARTRLEMHLDSTDAGALMASLGMPGQLQGGTAKARLDAAWRGGPQNLAPAAVTGTLALQVRDGQLVEIEPGAGRVLGLFGLAQLPRRLTLDFRDFFEKGFAFDSAGGDIRIGDGLARSENLAIKGPAADIRIRGAADLVGQRFDQTIEVQPHTGNLLTVAGALAGGPVGAALGAAANAVLKKPIGQMSARTYRVTGPWKDPEVEVVDTPISHRARNHVD